MKHILVAFAILIYLPFFGQENFKLQGTIKADSLQSAAVHIINLTQKTGTVNNEFGKFSIAVRENDTLLFSSIQYKNISLAVTSYMLGKGTIEIELYEDVNELAEVKISNIDLTGNISTDVAGMEIVKDMPVNVRFNAIKNITFEADAEDPHGAAPVNLAFQQNQIGSAGGVNILGAVGLISDLIGRKKDNKITTGPIIPNTVKLRKLFDDEFFETSILIKEDYIEDFIHYLDENGLTAQMFNKENRLSLIEFMLEQGENYRKFKAGK